MPYLAGTMVMLSCIACGCEQVQEEALRKHGGEDGLQDAKHKRVDAIVTGRVEKRKREEGATERDQQRLESLRKRIESENEAPTLLGK